ncbi:hypothetical protein AVEN_223297-1 [Araneus ventricosus]|uniref:Uncharacterized protein n=1 Tax=Araneus ventricosus TaxID=182803 RepID=A0A4Y2GBJ0_ARAVE|nr:hypothetical protein AVEN_223297-1 [Araneus ventricosus]
MSGKLTKSGEQVRLSAAWTANEISSGAVRIRSWWLNQSELSCGKVLDPHRPVYPNGCKAYNGRWGGNRINLFYTLCPEQGQ